MIIKTKICDCCKKELINHWEETCNYLKLETSQSCRNPLKEISLSSSDSNYQQVKINLNDICFGCIRKINNGIAEIFKELNK